MLYRVGFIVAVLASPAASAPVLSMTSTEPVPNQFKCPNPNFPYPSTCADNICYNSPTYAECGWNPGPSVWCCNHLEGSCPKNMQYPCTSSTYRSSTISFANNLNVTLTTKYWYGLDNSYIWLNCDNNPLAQYQGSPSPSTAWEVCAQTIKPGQTAYFTVYSDSSSASPSHTYKGALTLIPTEAYSKSYGLHEVILNYDTSETNRAPYPYTFDFVVGEYTAAQVQQYSGCEGGSTCTYADGTIGTYYCPYDNTCNGYSANGIASPVVTCGTNPSHPLEVRKNACPTSPTSTKSWQMTNGYPRVKNIHGGNEWEQYTVSISEGLSFSGYTGHWVWIGNGDYTITESTTWSQEDSTTVGSSFDTSMKESLSEETDATFLGMGEKITMGFEATESFTKSTSATISHSESKTESHSMQVNCPNGNIFQWATYAEPSIPSVGRQTVMSLSFACVPMSLGPYTTVQPKCPAGYGSDLSYQCCSGKWSANGQDQPYLTPSEGGTCTTSA